MNREEFDSGEYQEWIQNPEVTRLINTRTVFDGEDFEEARDEMYDPEPDWSERDERIWQEYCEMKQEEVSDFLLAYPEE